MRISVLIVTRNRLEDIKVTIDGFLRQTYADKEIIVVDNGSVDGTKEYVPLHYPSVKYYWFNDNFEIRANNIALEFATGDIIWKTDSDSHPETEHEFDKVINIFNQNPGIDIICMEDIEVRRNNTVWEWYPLNADKTNIPPDGYQSNVFAGTGAAIRRKVFDNIGGFWGFGFEELDFCTRAIINGFSVRYFPNVRVLHYASLNDRNITNRWLISSNQLVRYNSRYFPIGRSLGRSFFTYFYQIFIAIITGVRPLAIIEGFFSMPATAISTLRNERNVIPKDKMQDATLGVSLVKSQVIYLKHLFSSKIKKVVGR